MGRLSLFLLVCTLFFSSCGSTQQLEKNEANSSSIDDQNNQNALLDDCETIVFDNLDHSLMKDVALVGDWEYFLYPFHIVYKLEFDSDYPSNSGYVLFRQREDGSELQRVSDVRCDEYQVIGDGVYFASYSTTGYEHGKLYLLDGEKEPQQLAEELHNYQIVGDTIYYVHSYDTVGVGIEGHALHGINLDGSGHRIAAYEVSGLGIGENHWGFRVDGDYAYLGNVRIQLGNPADGTEKVELIEEIGEEYAHLYDDGYLYYGTTKLMKATFNGTEQVVLDKGTENSWYGVDHIDLDYIYYSNQINCYRIKKDGTEKEEVISPNEALTIVVEYWSERYPTENIRFLPQNYRERNGKSYYGIKIYENLPNNKHIATLVVYYVDIADGEIYTFDNELYNEKYVIGTK